MRYKPYVTLVTGLWSVITALGMAAPALGQSPHLGYLYPAGGQQSVSVEVMAGGQFLRGARDVYITGEGVSATVTEVIRPLNNDTLRAIAQKIREIRRARAGQPPAPPKETPEPEEKPVLIPNHPLLRNLESLSPPELQYVENYFSARKRQKNAQIGETALLQLTIAPDAQPGVRELRVQAAGGLSNPIYFEVGALAEAMEHEPNEPPVTRTPPAVEAMLQPPLVLNGQILPGDVDRVWFQGRKGQSLTVDVAARQLIPFLADAVPGWFQATVTLFDATGRELAFADDYQFQPDPALCITLPQDGAYALEITDALFRGREDFVYRLALGELPFVTAAFPLGAQADTEAHADLTGWNLPAHSIPLDTKPAGRQPRQARVDGAQGRGAAVAYRVDTLPECMESEPNGGGTDVQALDWPTIINGRLDKPGDTDCFQFTGHAGDVLVAEVTARQLGSPLDAVLYVIDPAGAVLAWNDDREAPNTGVITHHADAYLRATLPVDGLYGVKLADAQRQGGDSFAYRLRISPPQPDFTLYATPSTLNLRAGLAVPVTVHALRTDGFGGEITVAIAGEEQGFSLQGGVIPAGRDQIRMTITAPPGASGRALPIRLRGTASIGEKAIHRPVIPAEDMMQAFLYRHLVPVRQLLAFVQGGKRPSPAITITPAGCLRIPAGGSAELQIQAPPGPTLERIHLALSEAPEGLTLTEVRPASEGLALVLSASGGAAVPGFTDNLIVTATMDAPPNRGAAQKKNNRVDLGVLPAIPIEVVAP